MFIVNCSYPGDYIRSYSIKMTYFLCTFLHSYTYDSIMNYITRPRIFTLYLTWKESKWRNERGSLRLDGSLDDQNNVGEKDVSMFCIVGKLNFILQYLFYILLISPFSICAKQVGDQSAKIIVEGEPRSRLDNGDTGVSLQTPDNNVLLPKVLLDINSFTHIPNKR